MKRNKLQFAVTSDGAVGRIAMKLTKYLNEIEELVQGQDCANKVHACTTRIREQVEADLRLGSTISRFRESDPASHVLQALGSLGEGSFTREEVADRARFSVMKVDHLLEMLDQLGDVEVATLKHKKRYKLNRGRLAVFVEEGIV